MLKQLRKLTFLLMVCCFAISNARVWNYSDRWQDLDGDGVIELLDQRYSGRIGYLGDSRFIFSDGVVKKNGVEDIKINTDFLIGKNYYTADVNNDGRPDLISTTSWGLNLQHISLGLNGEQFNNTFQVLSWNEYMNLKSELKLSTGGEGIPGWGDMVGSDKGSLNLSGLLNVDINGDGLIDMVNSSDGKYFLNIGNDRYVENSLGGNTEVRDLNGDGIADFVTFKKDVKVTLNMADGRSITKELYNGELWIEQVYCFDFDHDGDVDILAPINYWYTSPSGLRNGSCYLLYFENQGNGSFVMEESWVEGVATFCDCVDIDSDGTYEIIAIWNQEEVSSSTYELRSYKIQPGKIGQSFTTLNVSKYSAYGSGRIANLKNDGIPYFIYSNDATASAIGTKANARPSAPGKPKMNYDSSTELLRLNWDAATDAESSPCDLSYELRVGTAPDKDDVVPACALPDGRRRIFGPGANGYLRYRTIDVSSWPNGRYYISVQAIDPNQQGSPFSEQLIFDKKSPSARIYIDAEKYCAAGDTITATIHGGTRSGISYEWNVDGAQIIEKANDNSLIKLRYPTGGNKQLKLTATGNGTSLTYTRDLNLRPISIKSFNYLDYTVDLDCDGSDEYFSSPQFYEAAENGNINPIHKTWNNNLKYIQHLPSDANKDGLVDYVCIPNSYTKGLDILHNNGNKNISITKDVPIYTKSDIYAKGDFNNDGNIDYVIKDENYRLTFASLSSDCQSYSLHPMNVKMSKILYCDDMNGDGLLDLYSMDENSVRRIFYNKGNFQFEPGEATPSNSDNIYPSELCDLDFDGKLDYIYNKASSAYGVSSYTPNIEILFGNSHHMYIPCPDGRPYSSIVNLADYDNNGMLDICIGIQEIDPSINGYTKAIIHLFPDYTSTVCNYEYTINGGSYYGSKVAHLNGGRLIIGSDEVAQVKNERPEAPSNIRSKVKGDMLLIEWDAAKDAETPSPGLLYNVSLRHAGATGAGAYILSPMNMERDNVSVPTDHHLIKGTSISIPISAVPAGEYEVRIQTVDGQRLTGKFSDSYRFTVSENISVDAPTNALVGNPVTISITSNTPITDIGFGAGAEIVSSEENASTVRWSTPGVKDITVDGAVLASVKVHDAVVGDFQMPEKLLAGSKVELSCMDARKGSWEVSNGTEFVPVDNSDILTSFTTADDNVRFTVNGEGTFHLRHTVSTEYGSGSAEKSATIIKESNRPEITTVSAGNNGYTISWDTTRLPEGVDSVAVYRETNKYNDYRRIATVDKHAGTYTDTDARPSRQSERYVLSYILPYGESAASQAHQPIHLMVNQGAAGSINLQWSKYEGQTVESYIILGGESADKLTQVATVSGNKSSYSDSTPKAYYAVSHTTATPQKVKGAARAAQMPMSNIVASADAQPTVLIESLTLSGDGGATQIDLNRTNSLQMRAIVAPAGVSYSQLDWELTEGGDIAEIDGSGMITAKSTGSLTVKGTARDGSGLSAQTTIPVVKIERPITWIDFSDIPSLSVEIGQTVRLRVKYKPDDPTEQPIWESEFPSVASVDQNGVVTGLMAGTTTITARSGLNPDIMIFLQMTVTGESIPVTDINLTPRHIKKKVGQTIHIDAVPLPENATNKCLSYSVDPYDTKVISIKPTETGVDVSLLEIGKANIYVCPSNGDFLRIINVEVTETDPVVPITWMGFGNYPEDWTIDVGETFTYQLYISPVDYTETPVWESTDPSIATVDQYGTVTGLAPGTVYIRARSVLDPTVYAEGIITVNQPVTDFQLSQTEVEEEVGRTVNVTATFAPANAGRTELVWALQPEDSQVVSVKRYVTTQDGSYVNVFQLSLLEPGSVDIIISTQDGSISKTINVNVIPDVRPFTSIEFTQTAENNEMNVGDKVMYLVHYEPENATDELVIESSNNNVAYLQDMYGTITAWSPGKTVISARSRLNPEVRAEVELTVKQPVKDIILSTGSISGNVGDIVHIDARVTPNNATDKSLIWEPNPEDTDVYTIVGSDTGADVTLSHPGSAMINVHSADGAVTDKEIEVVVTDNSGIPNIYAPDSTVDIFSIDGILVKKDATREDIQRLLDGVYIFHQNGKSFKFVKGHN